MFFQRNTERLSTSCPSHVCTMPSGTLNNSRNGPPTPRARAAGTGRLFQGGGVQARPGLRAPP